MSDFSNDFFPAGTGGQSSEGTPHDQQGTTLPEKGRSSQEQAHLDLEIRNRAEKIVQQMGRNPDKDELLAGIGSYLLNRTKNNNKEII